MARRPARVPRPKFTVPEVWRTIVKKNDRQGGKLFDVLICDHAVPANDNTYRQARACPECRLKVQAYADELAKLSRAATPTDTGTNGGLSFEFAAPTSR